MGQPVKAARRRAERTAAVARRRRLMPGSSQDRSRCVWRVWIMPGRRSAYGQRLVRLGISPATLVSAVVASVGPMATLLPELLLTDPAALRTWLEEHHTTSPGVRLVLTKKGGSDTTITWASAVE